MAAASGLQPRKRASAARCAGGTLAGHDATARRRAGRRGAGGERGPESVAEGQAHPLRTPAGDAGVETEHLQRSADRFISKEGHPLFVSIWTR